MNKMRFLPLALFLLLYTATFSQHQQMMNFNVLNGLPSSEIYDVIQDDYGYIWFSTDRGLSRYNGYEFENFDKSDGLSDNVVFDFLKNDKGEIWCTTLSSELFKITGKNPVFTPYEYNAAIKKYSNNLITTGLYFTPEGDMLMRFHHRTSYLRISKSGKVIDTTTSRQLVAEYYSMVVKDDNSEPFFYNSTTLSGHPTSDHLIFKFDESLKNEAVHFENKKTTIYLEKIILIKNATESITIQKRSPKIIASGKLDNQTFWVGYNGAGVEVYSTDGTLKNHLLKDKFVSQIYIDLQGNTWISTLNSGVFLQRKTNIKVLETDFDKESRVHSIEKNNLNEIYVGYFNGRITFVGLDRISKVFSAPKTSAPAMIKHCAHSNVTYFNSNHTIFSTASDSLFEADSKFIFSDDDTLYFGNRVLMKADKNNSISHFYIDERISDFMTFNGRYYSASLNGLIWNNAGHEEVKSPKLLLDEIRIDALEKMNSRIVAASTGHGIYILDKEHYIVSHITKRDGLSSNFVSNVYTENDSTLWVCTNSGINKIEFDGDSEFRISTLDHSDGLLSNEVWDLTVANDTVWVGTQLGVNFFSKDYIEHKSSKTINYFLQLTDLVINDAPIGLRSKDLVLNYDENKIEFQFEGMNFQKQLKYRYRLKGLDKKWNYTENRNVTYTSLPPGSYTFIVQTSGGDGKWSANETRYTLTIAPPYWDELWFKISITLLILLIIYLFFKYRILSYNREIFREILRFLLKFLKRKAPAHIIIKYQGKEIKLLTSSILYIKSSGNYLDIYTEDRVYITRLKIGEFLDTVSDPIEFLRIHRSYIIRLDQVNQKSSKAVVIGTHEIPVGRKYWGEVDNIKL